MSALVQLVGVSKTFGDAAAVHAIDLLVERGKTTVLIGPSGCGKSTLEISGFGQIVGDQKRCLAEAGSTPSGGASVT